MLYLVIPTINGEINGYASIYSDKKKLINEVNYECIIYIIDTKNQLLTETDLYEIDNI